MIELELKRSWKRIILQISIIVGILCAFLIFFIIASVLGKSSSDGGILVKLTSLIESMPAAFLPFLGITNPINLTHLINFLLIVNMYINIFFIIKAVFSTINIVEKNYQSGFIYSIYNQLMDRQEHIYKRLLLALINFFSVYLCYWWFLFACIFVSEIKSGTQKQTIPELLIYFGFSIIIYITLISISFFIGCIKSKDSSSGTISGSYAIIVFLLSNLYKIFYVVEYIVGVKSDVSNSKLIGSPTNISTDSVYYKLTHIFSFIKILSPFNWVNPYFINEQKIYIILISILSCILVSSFMIYFGITMYQKREL